MVCANCLIRPSTSSSRQIAKLATAAAQAVGLADGGNGRGLAIGDYDTDGDPDLYIANQTGREQDQFYRNDTGETGVFVPVGHALGLEFRSFEVGAIFGDYDGDGDLDMIVANTRDKVNLYRNETISNDQSNSANWIRIWLEGTMTNRNAFGTEVKITIDGKSYYRWHHGAGFLGQSIKPVHFGLADATTIDEIEVTWLSGLVQTFENIA